MKVTLTLGTVVDPPVYLGCFKDIGGSDNLAQHDLNGYWFKSSSMSNTLCANTCRSRGFPYAGSRFGNQCYCGDSFGKFDEADDPNACHYGCDGARGEICGGLGVNSVYSLE